MRPRRAAHLQRYADEHREVIRWQHACSATSWPDIPQPASSTATTPALRSSTLVQSIRIGMLDALNNEDSDAALRTLQDSRLNSNDDIDTDPSLRDSCHGKVSIP